MRFKEWSELYYKTPLKKCLKIKSGKDQKSVEDKNGIYNIYGSGGVIGKTNSFLYNKPSVCIGRKGTIDKPYYFDDPFWTVDTLFYSEIFQGYDPKYIFFLFQTIPWKLYNSSTGVPSLTSTTIEGIEKAIPCLDEQKKVAEFLTLIDERISTQIKIIEGYKSLINGITETVLSNSTGEEISLRTVLSEQKEYSPKNNDYPHVTLSKDGIYEKGERYDRDFLVKNEEKEYKISHYNDICYNPANLKFGVITINKFGDCIFSPIYVTFKINKKYNPDFIALCICRNNFINRARKFEQGTVYERMSVSPDDLLSMTIKLPSLEMQNTIVNNVTSIKNKIMIEEKFLKALNDEKRYLLNNLFI